MQEADPNWLDKTGIGVIGIIALTDGRQVKVECTGFNDETDELLVEILSSNTPEAQAGERDYPIPLASVLSFTPQQRNEQSWPHSDPCLAKSFSLARFAVLTTVFLSLTAGGLLLFIVFMNQEPYRLQELSAVIYTLFELFFTFAATRGARRYLFTCPAVEPHLLPLVLRHLGFLIGLFALQTIALAIQPRLPEWWNAKDAKGGTPFELALILLCISLGYTQVFLSRSILERAHRNYVASRHDYPLPRCGRYKQ